MLRLALALLLLASPALAQSAAEREAAERHWAAQNAARDAGWRIVYFAGQRYPCIPVAQQVPGVRTPQELLAAIRAGDDPHAYMDNGPADAWERVIRTRGHNLRLVQSARHCMLWNSMYR